MPEDHPASPPTADGTKSQQGETHALIAPVNGSLVIDLAPRFVPVVGSNLIVTFLPNNRVKYTYMPPGPIIVHPRIPPPYLADELDSLASRPTRVRLKRTIDGHPAGTEGILSYMGDKAHRIEISGATVYVKADDIEILKTELADPEPEPEPEPEMPLLSGQDALRRAGIIPC